MKKALVILILIVFFSVHNCFCDEDLDLLVAKFPSVILNFSTIVEYKSEIKTKWVRSNIIDKFALNQFVAKDNQVFINKVPVDFLSTEQSKLNYPEFNQHRDKQPYVVYKWQIEIVNEGFYLLALKGNLNAIGYLNSEATIILSSNAISIDHSGSHYVKLGKGINTLYILTSPGSSNQLTIISKSQENIIKEKILKNLTVNNKDNYLWITTVFLPYLCTLQNGIYSYINKQLFKLNELQPFEKNIGMSSLLRSYILGDNHDSYMIEKFIYTNYLESYFRLPIESDIKKNNESNFLINNNLARTVFLKQLIYDGQKLLAEKYFQECIEIIKANNNFKDKNKFIAAFYAERFISYFRIGRIADANEIQAVTSEVCKGPVLEKFLTTKPYQENEITLTRTFDETLAYQIKELIESYDGAADQLTKIYDLFGKLNSNLVKAKDGANSLFYLFQYYKSKNKKLIFDFGELNKNKLRVKIKKAKEELNLKLLEELLENNEVTNQLSEIRLILMEEYFKKGAILKALSQAYFIFDNYQELQKEIIPKLIVLENNSELPSSKKKIIPEKLLAGKVNLMGEVKNISSLIKPNFISENKIGLLLASIPLEATHIQYWNHPTIPFYQPIEPIFTDKGVVLNGGSYLINYSLESFKVKWAYHSESEYKKEKENGPHQKRFITRHSGNQLFMFTNREYSEQKTIKSFDLKGNLLWDISDQKNSLGEEPICTPIVSQGKLFGLSYNSKEDLITVNYTVYDTFTGELLSKTPLSLIPNSYRNENCGKIDFDWNTFTHDDHFTEDGSNVYGYSGTGVIFKADSNSGNLLWAKGIQKPSTSDQYSFWSDIGHSPSGYIQIFDDALLTFLPNIQLFVAINKNSGEQLWKSIYYDPKYIHAREQSEFLYFSSNNLRQEPFLYKIDPKNGKTIWQMPTNGLAICGEGDFLGGKLYIPSDKSILVFDEQTGKLIETVSTMIQPLKIRCNVEFTIIFTASTAFIFENKGEWKPMQCVDLVYQKKDNKFIEPNPNPTQKLSFENINLELSIKIPEAYFTPWDPRKITSIESTSIPFHFLLTCQEHVALFREGFNQTDGRYIPPEILWYGQYQSHSIIDDTIYISEFGKIIALNLFSREKIWEYKFNNSDQFVQPKPYKAKTLIAASKELIAFQTNRQSICVLTSNTQKEFIEIYSPIVKAMVISQNYIVALDINSNLNCYDLSQKGKILWTKECDFNLTFGIEESALIVENNRIGMLIYYDLKTGIEKINIKTTTESLYSIYKTKLNSKQLFAFDMLYELNTCLPIKKYKEVKIVKGGGLIGFIDLFGSKGFFIDGEKEYSFVTQCLRNRYDKLFAATRKGNRVFFFTSWGVETFEILNNYLVSIDFTKFNTGPNNNHEGGMGIYPLDNSVLVIKNDEMHFYRSFDVNMNYEKIKSFRVENKKNVKWPYSECYPEIEVNEKNWISYNGVKPKRKFSYQAFSDENFAYLKFILSPKQEEKSKDTLFISANGLEEVFAISWSVDNWKNCQYTYNIKNNIDSWKEIDIHGNLILYIKLQLTPPISSKFKNTLPDFNIELRQISDEFVDGMFRVGGAYANSIKPFAWLEYMNDEAQLLKNFNSRTNIYEKSTNFYPLGDDIVSWLKDRRRIKGVENNIQVLAEILKSNSKFYCSVNILSALFLEEIFYLKKNQPDLLEISDEFSDKVKDILVRLNRQSLEYGVKKEWVDFALSFWTIEVFPFKDIYSYNGTNVFKAINGFAVFNNKEELMREQFQSTNNLLTPNINQPYLEWVLPGLAPNFPLDTVFGSIELNGIGSSKTGFGRMFYYSPSYFLEFCNREGIFTTLENKITSGNTEIKLVPKRYFFKGTEFECFNVLIPKANYYDLKIKVPAIKSPSILLDAGQTAESVLSAIDNLPSDSKKGVDLVDYYLKTINNTNEKELITVYGRWLNTMKENKESLNVAIRSIFIKYSKQKNNLEIMGSIMKAAKLPPAIARNFLLDHSNFFSNISVRSIMGPCVEELIPKPELTFEPFLEYKVGELKYKFTENIDNELGGVVYIASKITTEVTEKAYFFLRSNKLNFATNKISIFLNGMALAENINFFKNDENIIMQKLDLVRGENILLFKIIGAKDDKWTGAYSFIIGDLYGALIKGVNFENFQNK